MLIVDGAHGFNLYYYDIKKNGGVDYLIDDSVNLTTIPMEVKSGKDYTRHSALDKFLSVPDYRIKRAFVLSNEQNVFDKGSITDIPIYYVMFFRHDNERYGVVFLGSTSAYPPELSSFEFQSI